MTDSFFAQYRDVRWQKMAARMKEASGWECQNCGAQDEQLHVHHRQYFKGRKVWEYSEEELQVLCGPCHTDAGRENELIKKFLALNNRPASLAAVLGGVLHWDEHLRSIDPGLTVEAAQSYPLAYAAGFIASLCESHLTIDQMWEVANFIASLTPDQSEARPKVQTSGRLFGQDE